MSDAAPRRRLHLTSAAALCLVLHTGPALCQAVPAEAAGSLPAPAATASDPLSAQLAELQRMLVGLARAETERRAESARLQEQIAQLRAEVEWHERVLPWLTVVLAVLGGAVGLLAAAVWRRRMPAVAPAEAELFGPTTRPPRSSLPPEVERTAPRPAEPPPPTASSTRSSRTLPPAPPVSSETTTAAAFDRALPERPEFVSSTRPVPQLFTTPAQQPPALGAESLIDLEQQADFFLALGQDEAAVERLLAELRTVEGRSPMPWLKLLQIHRRQDDVAAYQRALERFRQRFAVSGDEWAEPDLIERHLDDYPAVLAPLQRAWREPRQAMALLERLAGGTEPGVLLSLPASQDALLLYQLARSYLPEAPAEPASDVDLLLPMDAAAARQAGLQRAAAGGRLDVDLSSGYAPLGR